MCLCGDAHCQDARLLLVPERSDKHDVSGVWGGRVGVDVWGGGGCVWWREIRPT